MKHTIDPPQHIPRSPAALAGENGLYLGPAKVLRVEAGAVYVECPDAYARAVSALGFPYEPLPGDLVLVIGQSNAWFIIGVLSGTGKTILQLPGDLEVRAPQGSVSIHAGKDIRLQAAAIRLIGLDIELLGKWIWHRCEELSQKIQGLFRTESGSCEQHVQGDMHNHAARMTQSADGDIRLRGKTINLN